MVVFKRAVVGKKGSRKVIRDLRILVMMLKLKAYKH